MNSLRSLSRNIPLLLCLVCLLAFGGCQRQRTAAVTGESSEFTEINDTVLSQDTLTESEIPVISSEIPSSEETPVSSKEEPASSQPIPEPPASQAASSSAGEASSQVSPPSIPFTVGAVDDRVAKIPFYSANTSLAKLVPKNAFGAIVIRSAAEYRERFAPDTASISSDSDTDSTYPLDFSNYLSKYNETFFEENALIYMSTYHARSASLNDYIHSLVRSGNQLTIEYTTALSDDPDPNKVYCVLTAGGGRQTLLEVKQSDVEGVTEIVPQQSGEDTPPTRWF